MPSQTVTAARARPDSPVVDRPVGKRVRSRAPLRLGLAGGGTDVSPYADTYGGVVLNVTIDRYCYATLEERFDDQVVLCAPDIDVVEELGPAPGRLALHAAIYRRICRDFDLGHPALTVTTVSDAPPGSGLGSSSTLVVAVIEAFREYFSLPMGDYDVARLAYSVERQDCGLQGGRQDQYAATFGGFNMMEFGADERVIVNPLRLKPAIVHELEASLVLYHTGVSRASAQIIEQQTSHVRAGDGDRIEATHALRREAVAMKESLLVGDLGAVAEVLARGWEAKKRLADGITTSNIDEAFAAALSGGALAGKVSGAGGGGYVMFVVDPTRRPQVVRALGALGSGEVTPTHFVTEGAVAWTIL